MTHRDTNLLEAAGSARSCFIFYFLGQDTVSKWSLGLLKGKAAKACHVRHLYLVSQSAAPVSVCAVRSPRSSIKSECIVQALSQLTTATRSLQWKLWTGKWSIVKRSPTSSAATEVFASNLQYSMQYFVRIGTVKSTKGDGAQIGSNARLYFRSMKTSMELGREYRNNHYLGTVPSLQWVLHWVEELCFLESGPQKEPPLPQTS